MTQWVALLRGVNVGGVTLRNDDLCGVFENLGLSEVRAVLASGNVRFASPDEPPARAELRARIEAALADRFAYAARLVLVTLDELEAAIHAFPFEEADASRQPWVIFCSDEATRDELVEAAASLDGDVDSVARGPGVVFWNPPRGRTTDSPFGLLVAKVRYRERTTTRNVRTLRKIAGLGVS